MAVLKNRAKMSTSTTGTGTITLGSAESGYQTFADAGVANSDIVRYVIEDDAAWEIGTGTYTASGTTLTRTVSESSNSDAALNLSGAAVVFVGATAEDILQPANNLSDLASFATARTNLGLGSFTRKFSETSGTAGSTSGDWMTVAGSQSSRRRGEVLVSDADSGDHAFIRIDWLRSYADTTFTVLSCGGHQNRITGVRVLKETADPTYGWKYLQVYVVASSFYRVQTFIPADTSGWTGHTAVTPIVQNTLTGYSVQGAALSGLDTYPLASQQGILAGDDIQTYGDILVGGTVDGVDIAARDAVLTSTTTTANAALPKAGGTMTGNLSFGDNDKAIFGASGDLEVYHDGSNSYVRDTGTGNLILRGSNLQLRGNSTNELYITCVENGGVSLSYDDFIRFATTSTGINVNGTITATVQSSATTTPVPVATFHAAYSSTGTSDGFGPRVILKGEGADGSAQDFAYIDSVISYWGTGTDLVFYTRPNNGTPTETLRFKYGKSAHFQDSIEIGSDEAIYSSGTMRVASDTKVEITNFTGSGSKIMADFTVDGAARLYDNEIIRLATTSTGIDVTGTVTATSFSGGGIPTLFVESSGTATAPNSSDSVAIGGYAVSSGANSTALGRANAGGTDSFAAAIGDVTTTYGAQGTGSISIGTLSKATQIAGTAVGYGATSTHQASSAFGTSATTTANNQIALGGSGVTARISGAYTLPAADGTANQVLTTDGSGAVTFATAAGGSSGLPIALSIVFGR